jgi:chemotaxis protein methyltransferase CheR
VLPKVRERVSFLELNLVQDPFPPLRGQARPFDIVVCRNVLIYVDASALPGVIGKLVKMSAQKSLLVLSPAEYPAREHAPGFEDLGHALLFRGGAPKPAVKKAAPTRPTPPPVVEKKKPRPAAPRVSAVQTSAREAPQQPAVTLEQVNALIQQTADSPGLYLLRGQLQLAASEPALALRDFRAALFLQPGFPAAELGCAQSLLKEGRAAEAERSFARVLALLESEPADAQVEGLDVTVAWVRKLAGGQGLP